MQPQFSRVADLEGQPSQSWERTEPLQTRIRVDKSSDESEADGETKVSRKKSD